MPLGSVNRSYINGSGGHVEFQICTKITNSDEINQKETSLQSLFPFGKEVSEKKMLTDNDDDKQRKHKVTTIVFMVF